jgi:hypothetical protein
MADDGEHHSAYLKVYEVFQDREHEMMLAFDDMRRSQALLRLLHFRKLKLLTDEEWGEFTEETRERVFNSSGP